LGADTVFLSPAARAWLSVGVDDTLRVQVGLGETKLRVAGWLPADGTHAPLAVMDIGAAQWLFELFDTVANKWGYELIKIDFVDWSLLSAERYHDPGVTRAQAYRKGVEIMRKAIGDKCHLLDCGPGPVSVGMLDSMRIELDQPPVTWNQYFLKSSSSAPAAAKRYYFHKRTWINDADHVCLAPLPVSQAQAAAAGFVDGADRLATIVTHSGGLGRLTRIDHCVSLSVDAR
jgi:hypothetical protein